MLKRMILAGLACGFASAATAAAQSLDAPEYRTFDDKLPREKKKADPVEQTFEKTIVIERDKSALVLCSEGAASGEGLEDALKACDAAIEERPEDGDGYYYRGIVLAGLDRWIEAEDDFTNAIENDASKLAESYYRRGVCKEEQRRLREAAADFKTAAELKPEWSAARRKVDEYHWAYE